MGINRLLSGNDLNVECYINRLLSGNNLHVECYCVLVHLVGAELHSES